MRQVAPTKTSLLQLRHDLEFARLGHDLLGQKRDILVVELLTLVEQAVDVQKDVEAALAEAFDVLRESVLRLGKLRVTHVSNAVNVAADIKLGQRRVMGVGLPVVETHFENHTPYYSAVGTSFWNDSTVRAFRRALEQLGRLAELKVSIMRLATEVRKTVRKVNALERIGIPDLEETVDYIQNRLEENERDAYILMKMVKNRLLAAEGGRR
jgi:V/A-type H+-transporting ATPase subunit D